MQLERKTDQLQTRLRWLRATRPAPTKPSLPGRLATLGLTVAQVAQDMRNAGVRLPILSASLVAFRFVLRGGLAR